MIGQRDRPAVAHGTGIEIGDLVLLFVCADKKTGSEFIWYFDDVIGADPVLAQPGRVVAEILADCSEEYRVTAQEFEGVGDIGGSASALANHIVYEKTDAQAGQFFGNYLVGEPPGKVIK